MSVSLNINSCGECPYKRSKRYLTCDNWKYVEAWYCVKTNRPPPSFTDHKHVENSSLIDHVERNSGEPKEIPDWCPLR